MATISLLLGCIASRVAGRVDGAASPVGVDDFAEGQLAAHLQVALVFWQVARGAFGGVHLAVLVRLVQSLDELT